MDPANRAATITAPPPGHRRFPLLGPFRGFAVLAIIVVHTAVLTDVWRFPAFRHIGFVLTLFFVLSGFLLYRPFIAWRTGGPAPPRFRDYGLARFLRIAPGYWFALTLLAIYPGVLGPFSGEGGGRSTGCSSTTRSWTPQVLATAARWPSIAGSRSAGAWRSRSPSTRCFRCWW